MKRLLGLLWFLWPAMAFGQSVTLPAKLDLPSTGLVIVRATAIDADDARWWCDNPALQTFPPDLIPPKPGVFLGFTTKEGVYKVNCIPAKAIAGKAVLGQIVTCEVTVGSPAPPIPVTVTVPSVTGASGLEATRLLVLAGLKVAYIGDAAGTVASQAPAAGVSVPGGSTVTLTMGTPPSPAPIPAPGLRVLIIEETAERGKLTAGQRTAIFGQVFRDNLRAKCVKDAENPASAFRIYDKDVDLSGESKLWQDAMKRPRTKLPWLIISNPDKGGGYEGGLPEKIEDTTALLQRFGG